MAAEEALGIEEKTAECVVRHIKAFFEQSTENRMADFGEPCAECQYAEECKFDWFTKMKPFA